MKKTEARLRDAISTAGLLQPVSSWSKGSSVSVLNRQIPGQEKAWLRSLKEVLLAARTSGAELHSCRDYVLKGPAEDLVYGWRLTITAKNAKDLLVATETLCQVIELAEQELTPAEEDLPMPQQSGHRGAPAYAEEGVIKITDVTSRGGKRYSEELVPLPFQRGMLDMNAPSSARNERGWANGGNKGAGKL